MSKDNQQQMVGTLLFGARRLLAGLELPVRCRKSRRAFRRVRDLSLSIYTNYLTSSIFIIGLITYNLYMMFSYTLYMRQFQQYSANLSVDRGSGVSPIGDSRAIGWAFEILFAANPSD